MNTDNFNIGYPRRGLPPPGSYRPSVRTQAVGSTASAVDRVLFAHAIIPANPRHRARIVATLVQLRSRCWRLIAARPERVIDCISATASVSSRRSEEHTSELQSLMRISYAVF